VREQTARFEGVVANLQNVGGGPATEIAVSMAVGRDTEDP
jgi:hypothetical protein